MPLDTSYLDSQETIVFGPFIGGLSWELLQWSGFVRWYKKRNPSKNIIVCTRQNRADLYTGCVDDMILFTIEGDYIDKTPSRYDCLYFPENLYQSYKQQLKIKYPNSYIFEPRLYQQHEQLFDTKCMDFEYTPHENNKKIIDKLLSEYPERTPITICSRNRIDKPYRNWPTGHWRQTFETLHRSQLFITFVSGVDGSYFKSDFKSCYNLDIYSDPCIFTTTIGLTIEAMRQSKLTVGAQCTGIVLSNLLKTPTFFWGDRLKEYKDKNVKCTKSTSFIDLCYKMDYHTVWKQIKILST